MKYFTSIAIAILFSSAAHAGGDHTTPQPEPATQQQDQVQSQHQGQLQGQEQNASSESFSDSSSDSTSSSTSTSSSGGNSQAVTFTSPDDITIKRTVAAIAPSIDPSHPCALTWSAGLGITGVGLSGGKAYVDDECNARETARLFFQFGEAPTAIEILCNQPSAHGVGVCAPGQDRDHELALLKEDNRHFQDDNAKLRRELEAANDAITRIADQCDEQADRAFQSCQEK